MYSLRTFVYPDDYSAVYDLWKNTESGINISASDEPAEIEKKIQRDPELFLVAESGGKIVGTVMGGFDGRRGMVYHLAVEKEYRKNGIGKALMNELETRLRAKGCLKYYLFVMEDNEPAIQFYENLGWVKMDFPMYGKNL